ncbi:uncharacterized protein [Pseudochaenichthys georgianus]|uniref:uncharacterized protein n=1 Tax=Pseudochaenichthys georgianus TaxID=52239 RepID=UPI0039C2F442
MDHKPSFTFQAGTSDLQLKASKEAVRVSKANSKRAAPRLTSNTRELAEAQAASRVSLLGGTRRTAGSSSARQSSSSVSTGVRPSSGCCHRTWATRQPFWQGIRESVRGGCQLHPPHVEQGRSAGLRRALQRRDGSSEEEESTGHGCRARPAGGLWGLHGHDVQGDVRECGEGAKHVQEVAQEAVCEEARVPTGAAEGVHRQKGQGEAACRLLSCISSRHLPSCLPLHHISPKQRRKPAVLCMHHVSGVLLCQSGDV